MRRGAALPTLATTLIAGCIAVGDRAEGPTLELTPDDNLRVALDTLRGPATVTLAPGDYHLRPVPYTDPSCGNCEDPAQEVPATRGLRLQGTAIHVIGASARDVVIHTASGYGVLFDGCEGCSLEHVTVTGGIRDPDGRATNAAVVVRGGQVRISDCVLRDNLGDSAVVHDVVVGVSGVAVREAGNATVDECLIERNSWDGLVAYRGATLTATDNVVDGVDKATGAAHGGGRGVGIGLTWNAEALVQGNLVTRYWKGIGIFSEARAHVEENVVEDILTWGIAYWSPAGVQSSARVRGNAVFETGACGALIDRAQAGAGPEWLRENLFVRTGQNARYDAGEPYCHQRPIARHNVPDNFVVEGNVVHDVRQPGERAREEDLDRPAFLRAAAAVLAAIGTRPHLVGSRFYGAYGSEP
jgi:hypothetical protein